MAVQLRTNTMTEAHSINCLDLNSCLSTIVIVGLGATGVSVARYLAKRGYDFFIVDTRQIPPSLADFTREMPEVRVFLGEFPSIASAASHILVSPGISLSHPNIRELLDSGLKLISDIDLFVQEVEAPIVAITGSNGKSTVTTLVGEMVRQCGLQAGVGGNIGRPALDLISEISPDFYILELSSFQLERISELNCIVSTVLNVSPDHMDRYSDIDEYSRIKARIYDGDGVMVLNADDPLVRSMSRATRNQIWFSLDSSSRCRYRYHLGENRHQLNRDDYRLMFADELKMSGTHNIANALASLALIEAMGLPLEPCLQVLRTFNGLEHRMQTVIDSNGVKWINDSKATNVGACKAAIEGISGSIILIAGGECKGADFDELVPVVDEKVRLLILIGSAASKLDAALSPYTTIMHAGDLANAVLLAKQNCVSGDIVLLSPACASQDQFIDFQHRGRVFSAEVRHLYEH